MLTFATAIVRAWTWLYTAGLDADPRDDRRAQIESDLWDQKDEATERGVAPLAMSAHILARLALGIPDDLLWRGEQLHVATAVVTVMLGDAHSRPVTFRRASGFGVSVTVHVLLVMLAVWLAPRVTSVALHGNSSATTPTILFVPPNAVVPAPAVEGRPTKALDIVPEDNLGIKLGESASTLAIPGFTFNFSKVIAHAGSLFPFVTGTRELERIAATALLPRAPTELINPFGHRGAEGGGLPKLVLSGAEFQALVDRAWARRDRWNAFVTLVPTIADHNPDEGALPDLMRAYVEQNGLQPYVENDIHDPRLWTQLGVVADHTFFIDFIGQYIARHTSTKTATELLFLLDTLIQGSYDTLTALLDVIPEVDLHWTHEANPAAFDAIMTIQQHYRAELEHRNLLTRAALRLYFDEARISVLTNLIETTPGRYRENDARFLIGSIYWRQGREAAAVGAWSGLHSVPSDRYADASAAIVDVLRARSGPNVDSARINRVLDGERGRWISFSHDRLKQFGYRFSTF
jgi:hypothetical protein